MILAGLMLRLVLLLFGSFRAALHSRADLVIENLALRQQLAVLALSFAKTRSMSWPIELRFPPVLGAPRACEGVHRGRHEPERIDDAQVFKMAFRAGFAKKVLRDSESSCSLRRCERSLVVGFLPRRHGRADLSLAKTQSEGSQPNSCSIGAVGHGPQERQRAKSRSRAQRDGSLKRGDPCASADHVTHPCDEKLNDRGYAAQRM